MSTSWQRFSVQIAIPSVSGKTLGTNGDHFSEVNLWFSSGSSNNALAGGIGVQSGTIKFWGVQLEVGSVMTQFERPDPQTDLANCQRFFCIGSGVSAGAAANTFTISVPVAFPATMRATPTVSQTLTGGSGYTATTAVSTSTCVIIQATGTAAGYAFNFSFTASADL